MDFAQLLQQLWQNLSGLGPRRLVALGVVGLTLFATIAIGSYALSKSEFQPLYVGLTAQDASRMSAVLTELGIPFDVSPDATRISVPASAVARARGVLAERGLPVSATAGYELFDKIGPLGLTTFMQEVTRVRALEGEITRTIQGMGGVLSARVHLALGDKGSFRSAAQKPTASVILKLGVSSEKAPVDAVKNIVAAAVPGLSSDDVRIVSADGAVLSAGGESLRPGANRMLDLERAFVAQLKQNLTATLAPILGFANFESSVAVRLNADQSTVNESTFDPASKVERSVRVVKEAGNSKDSSADQSVSVERNVPPSGDAGQGAQQQKSNQRRDEITNYEISSKTVTTTRDGYRIEYVSVALVVNKAVLKLADGTPLDETAVAAKLAEIEKIATLSAGLDTARGDRITVSAQEFHVDELTATDLAADGLSVILQNNSSSVINAVSLVLAILAIVYFGLRPLLRVLIAAPPEVAVPALAGPERQPAGELPRELASARTAADTGAGSLDTRQGVASIAPVMARLNDLISRDPDQAVAVVRRWIRTQAS